jgi:hypothetical protein
MSLKQRSVRVQGDNFPVLTTVVIAQAEHHQHGEAVGLLRNYRGGAAIVVIIIISWRLRGIDFGA